MLLIFGLKVRTRLIGTVAFFCPRCGGDRQAHLQAARRWFTLFWIPIVPLKQLGTVVTCTTCQATFDEAVLDLPTTATLGEVLTNAVHALTLMIVRTGHSTDPALRAHAVRDLTAAVPGYDPHALDRDVAAVDPALAEQYLSPLAGTLEVAGKERFVADLVHLALAGGTVTDDQRRVIDLAGRGLGLTPVHITGIVTSVVSASSSGSTPPTDDTAPG